MGPFFRNSLHFAFHAAACLSVLALVACLLLWPRSYYRLDTLNYQTSAQRCGIQIGKGGWAVFQGSPTSQGPGFHFSSNPFPPGGVTDWSYLAWRTVVSRGPNGVDQSVQSQYLGLGRFHITIGTAWLTSFSIPLSYLALLSAILPTLWLRVWLRHRANRRGFPIETNETNEPSLP